MWYRYPSLTPETERALAPHHVFVCETFCIFTAICAIWNRSRMEWGVMLAPLWPERSEEWKILDTIVNNSDIVELSLKLEMKQCTWFSFEVKRCRCFIARLRLTSAARIPVFSPIFFACVFKHSSFNRCKCILFIILSKISRIDILMLFKVQSEAVSEVPGTTTTGTICRLLLLDGR